MDSIINQTLDDIEIICINDGSTDNSLKILEEYQKKDNRLKIISKENGGLSSSRNIGIDIAIGEYIGFVDSDDFIEMTMFEKLYTKSKEENTDMTMCKITLYNNKTKKQDKKDSYFSLKKLNNYNNKTFNHLDTKDVTFSICVTAPNKIYRTKFLKENNIKFQEGLIFEDEVFFYENYLKAEKVYLLNEHLYYYRINDTSIMRGENKDFTDVITIFKLIREKIKESGYLYLYKKQFYNIYLTSILTRFSETSEKYKNKFYNLMKEEFKNSITEENVDKHNYKININDLTEELKIDIKSLLKSENHEEFKLLKELNKLKAENKKLKKERKKLEKKQKEILNSKSWKITKPLRKFKKLLK